MKLNIGILALLVLAYLINECETKKSKKGQVRQADNSDKFNIKQYDSSYCHQQCLLILEDTFCIFVPNHLIHKTQEELKNAGFNADFHTQIFLDRSDSIIEKVHTKQSITLNMEEMHFEKFAGGQNLDKFKHDLSRLDKSMIFKKSRISFINGIPFIWVEEYSQNMKEYVIWLNTIYKAKSYTLTWVTPNMSSLQDSMVYYKSIYSIKLR